MCLLKTGACLIQVLLMYLPFVGTEYMLAYFTEVVTKTGKKILFFSFFWKRCTCLIKISVTCEEVNRQDRIQKWKKHLIYGAQWLSGRALDSSQRDAGSSLTGVTVLCPWARHINQSLLSTGSTQEDPSQHNRKIVDWDINNQIKHIF